MQSDEDREESLLAEKYVEDVNKARAKRKAQCYDEEALKLTGKILSVNSDYHTMWNFRREIILHWKDHGITCKEADSIESTNRTENNKITQNESNQSLKNLSINQEKIPDDSVDLDSKSEKILDLEKVYLDELKFASSCLVNHPKSYATWLHRRCIIKLMANPPITEEITACDHFLDLDERNFHCWDYRRFICELGNVDLKTELEFTQKKISQNYSNFSSFYYRSALLTLADRQGILKLSDIWDSEYETTATALFSDPNHQSLWFYLKWLLAVDQLITCKQPESETLLHKVLWDQSNQRLIYQFHAFLHEPPFKEISIVTENQAVLLNNIEWHKVGQIGSDIWFHQITVTELTSIDFNHMGKTYNIELTKLSDDSNLKFKIVSDISRGKKINPNSRFTKEKLDNLKKLHEIQPGNKWIKLTMAHILGGLNENAFEKLEALDPLRRNYYNDQKSKQIIEEKLGTNQNSTKLSLADQKLTCLYFTNHLTHLRFLDLTNNRFIKLNASFNNLVSLQTLILDNNFIFMIDANVNLLSLNLLSLKNNRITNMKLLDPLNNFPKFGTLDITGNKIDKPEEFQLSSNIKVIKD